MNDQVGQSLRQTLLRSELPSLIHDLGEIGVDSFLEGGVIKEIPVFGAVLAIGQAAGSIKDYFFAKKLLRFLNSIADLDSNERANLVRRLDQEPEFGAYAGERLMSLLSRLDEEVKAELVGKALKLYLRGRITSEQLQRINYTLERFLLCDLQELRILCSDVSEPRPTDGNPVTANFINAGLAYVSSGWGGGGVHPTETAALLLQVTDQDDI